MKVLIVDTFSAKAIDELKAAGLEVVYDTKMKEQLLTDGLKEHQPAILVVRSTKVQIPQLDAGAPALKMVVRAGSGYDTINTAAAKERGVAVCNTPGMNATAVAELVMGFIMTADRKYFENISLFRQGKWSKSSFAKCRGIKGSTLGLIGFGNIGKLVCDRARAFEMNVIAYDPFLKPEQLEAAGAKPTTDLKEIAANCDFISLHVPGGEKTKGLVGEELLALMKPGTVLINTARATVVDEAALIKHVTERGLIACCDVVSNEPSTGACEFKHPFAEIPGIYCTHHIGASTVQSEGAIGELALRVVLTYAQKGEILHQVN